MQYCEDCKSIMPAEGVVQGQEIILAKCRKTHKEARSRLSPELDTVGYKFCSNVRESDTCKNFEPKNIICDACEKPIEDPETIHVVGKDRICTPCYEDQGKAE